jgi:hypothetical protein
MGHLFIVSHIYFCCNTILFLRFIYEWDIYKGIPSAYSIFCTPAVMTTKSNNFKWRFLANARNDSAL